MTVTEKYGWVNAARGYAILLVVMVHVPQFLFDTTKLSWLSRSGSMGVQLFFVMSSFTLFNSYTKRSAENAAFHKRAFFVRRLFRIAPQYWLATAFYAAFNFFYFKNQINFLFLFANVFFVNGLYLPSTVYLPPGGWSIGVEMAFYLTIPLLFRLAKDMQSTVLLLILAIVISNLVNYAAYLYVQQHTLDWSALRQYELYFWFPNQFPVFFFGIILFHLYQSKRLSRLAGQVLLYGVAAVFLVLCFVPFSVEYPAYFAQKEYIYGLLFAAFGAGLYASESRLFNGSLIQKIGVVSFSLYLNHFFVLMVLKFFDKRFSAYVETHYPEMMGYIHNDVVLVTYYVLTVIVAYNLSRVTYQYIEINGIRLGERVLTRLGWNSVRPHAEAKPW